MAVNSIIPPYPSFFETDGTPLEDGFIYVGEPGLEAKANPKAAFFDYALTIPAASPMRTLAGFPVRNGAAAMIYVDGDFSITVEDRNNVLLYSALNRTFAFGTESGGALPIQAPDGDFGVAGFGFMEEPNTGFVRQGAGVVQAIVGGNVIYQWTETGVEYLLPPSGTGFVAGVAAALDQDLKDIAAISAVEGDMLYRNGTVWTRRAKGTAGQVLRQNDALTTPVWSAPVAASAGQSTTAGTAFDFTAIPAWVRRVTIIFDGISLSGSENFLVRLGTASGFVSAGYSGGSFVSTGGGGSYASDASGLLMATNAAGEAHSGHMMITRFGGGDTWVASHTLGTSARMASGGGSVALPATLTQVRLTRTGADTFDAGSVSIIYE